MTKRSYKDVLMRFQNIHSSPKPFEAGNAKPPAKIAGGLPDLMIEQK